MVGAEQAQDDRCHKYCVEQVGTSQTHQKGRISGDERVDSDDVRKKDKMVLSQRNIS